MEKLKLVQWSVTFAQNTIDKSELFKYSDSGRNGDVQEQFLSPLSYEVH